MPFGRRLTGEGVGHAGDQHPEMLQRDLGRQQRRLVPAMLRAGGGEDGGDLADQCIPRPEAAGLVEEGFHLPGHHAEERRRAEDDGVVGLQIGRRRDGRVVRGEAGLLPDLLGNSFRHATQVDMGAGHAACAFGFGLRKGADMAIAGIVENENAGHGILSGAWVSMPERMGDRRGRNNRPDVTSFFTPG